MNLNFTTRAAARTFAQSRTAAGNKTSVTDHGKDSQPGKRYSCTVAVQPVPASRASAPVVVTTRKGHQVTVVKKQRRVVAYF